MYYTYSRWNGAEGVEVVDPDELMEALSDDLMSDGNIWNALQRVIRWGMPGDQQRAPGLQNLLQRLRAQRQRELERYSLDSAVQDIKNQVDDIVASERRGIAERLGEAQSEETPDDLRRMMEDIATRKQAFLDALPDEIGQAITSLADYEFLDDGARETFESLMEMLQDHVLHGHFQSMQASLRDMTDRDVQDLKEMVRDLNDLLRERLEGEGEDFGRFMEKHGRHFPDVESLDQLIEHLRQQSARMDALMRSMSPDMRRSLDELMQSVLDDANLREELAAMGEALELLAFRGSEQDYAFSGSEPLTLTDALQLMQRMHDLDQLEQAMKQAQEGGSLEHVDSEQVRQLLGEEAGQAVDRLQQLTLVLEEAGYIERGGDSLDLTARGVRRIGQKALQDIFLHLKRDAFGSHASSSGGSGVDRTEEVKSYEFGDPFLLEMNRTLMNALQREGPGSPLTLAVRDFEVFRTERLTQASTVLMLDMSRSMPLRGCFVAAKKVALALNSLIRTQFPRDNLYIIGFSDYARELRPERLHQITWGDYVYGTNMQHGFVLARRLLGQHKTSTKQVILITDGEPTAHFEGDRVHFSYPPTFRTFQETLREVKRCTQEGIVINTFMLERSHYLTDFVGQMTRINRGRAFFATPERLGDYILVDYVSNKRKAL